MFKMFRIAMVVALANGLIVSWAWAQCRNCTPCVNCSYQTNVVCSTACNQGAMDALSIVNQKRAQRGLYPLNFDHQLTSVAQFKSQNRANRRITGHDGTNMGGARSEGVGYAYGHSNLAGRFQTCHLYSTSHRNAGAAIAYDSSGRAYYTLLLR